MFIRPQVSSSVLWVLSKLLYSAPNEETINRTQNISVPLQYSWSTITHQIFISYKIRLFVWVWNFFECCERKVLFGYIHMYPFYYYYYYICIHFKSYHGRIYRWLCTCTVKSLAANVLFELIFKIWWYVLIHFDTHENVLFPEPTRNGDAKAQVRFRPLRAQRWRRPKEKELLCSIRMTLREN